MKFSIKNIDKRFDPLREKFEQIKNGALPISLLGEVLSEKEVPLGGFYGDTFLMHILRWMPQYAKEAVALFHENTNKEQFNAHIKNQYGQTLLSISLEKGFHSIIHFYMNHLTVYPVIASQFLADIVLTNHLLFEEICHKYQIDDLNFQSENGISFLDLVVSNNFSMIDFIALKCYPNIIENTINKLKNGEIQTDISPSDYNNDYGPATKEAIEKLEKLLVIQEQKYLEKSIANTNLNTQNTLKI